MNPDIHWDDLDKRIQRLRNENLAAHEPDEASHPALLERKDYTLVACYRSLGTLAREGRMTVTIGRRELLAALGGVAAWPFAARAQQPRCEAEEEWGSIMATQRFEFFLLC